MNSLFILGIHFEYTICFANFLWIHNLLHEFTMNSLSFSWYFYKFTICIANSLLNCYLFREFTIKKNQFRGFGLNQPLDWARINVPTRIEKCYLLTLFSLSRRHIYSSPIQYCFHESTLNLLSIPRTQFESALLIANL